MARKIILLLCGLGILFYAYKIYHLKNSIQLFSSAPSSTDKAKMSGASKVGAGPVMRLKFTLETDKVEVMEACRKLFDKADDVIKLSAHPQEEGKAILNIERVFPSSDLHITLDLNKALKAHGCLNSDKDVFALETAQ